jgi:hypothetical protein
MSRVRQRCLYPQNPNNGIVDIKYGIADVRTTTGRQLSTCGRNRSINLLVNHDLLYLSTQLTTILNTFVSAHPRSEMAGQLAYSLSDLILNVPLQDKTSKVEEWLSSSMHEDTENVHQSITMLDSVSVRMK